MPLASATVTACGRRLFAFAYGSARSFQSRVRPSKNMLKARHIFETVIYVDDLEAAKRFYAGALNLPIQYELETFIAFQLEHSVLLVFDRIQCRNTSRDVPPHGMDGEGHVAFLASSEEIEQWKERFTNLGIEIEQVVKWPEGDSSVYVRDPSGNSVEFAPPTLWGGGWEIDP